LEPTDATETVRAIVDRFGEAAERRQN